MHQVLKTYRKRQQKVFKMDRLRSEGLSPLPSQPQPIQKSKVNAVLEQFKGLNRTEQVYFLLSIGSCNKPSVSDIQKTITWLRANFEEDSQVALAKEDVYSLYCSYGKEAGFKCVSTADFGKVVRQVFPEVKARRLGQRGNSKYCYANIKRKLLPDEPELPEIEPVQEKVEEQIVQWGQRAFGVPLESLGDFARVMGNQPGVLEKEPPRRSASLDEPELTSLQWPNLRQLLVKNSTFVPLTKRRHVSAYTACSQPPLASRSASVPIDSDSGFSSSTPRNPLLSSTADPGEFDLFEELFG